MKFPTNPCLMQDIKQEQEKLNSFFEKGVWLVSLVQQTRVLLRMLNRNKRHESWKRMVLLCILWCLFLAICVSNSKVSVIWLTKNLLCVLYLLSLFRYHLDMFVASNMLDFGHMISISFSPKVLKFLWHLIDWSIWLRYNWHLIPIALRLHEKWTFMLSFRRRSCNPHDKA
jgi:hypothetical protein